MTGRMSKTQAYNAISLALGENIRIIDVNCETKGMHALCEVGAWKDAPD